MSTRQPGRAGQLMRKIADVRLLPDDVAMPKDIDCHDDPCKFDLYYFFGKGFNLARPERKNILFIAGGPGALVDNVNQMGRMLGYLEAHHNVVYFDLRGGGRSVIPASNRFDRFLRAEYVADDIEKIRKAVLNRRPWDAIYSHSWGALPAQLYAARFGPQKSEDADLVRAGGARSRYPCCPCTYDRGKPETYLDHLPCAGRAALQLRRWQIAGAGANIFGHCRAQT